MSEIYAPVGQPRGTQRYTTTIRADENAPTEAIITLAYQYGRYATAGSHRWFDMLEGMPALIVCNASGAASGGSFLNKIDFVSLKHQASQYSGCVSAGIDIDAV